MILARLSLLVVAFLLVVPLRAQQSEPDIKKQLIQSAVKQVGVTVSYDPAYTKIPYPNGDVPMDRGVCTDVVIRAFRGVGIDLQQLVHEDMKNNFKLYPRLWGLSSTDSNIDHRRVPNLMTFFKRKGKSVPVTRNPADYHPADVVVWKLSNGLLHIGLVSDRSSSDDRTRHLIIHNIGSGTQIENRLFDFEIIGHYRYFVAQSMPLLSH